jgi:hypothetical protein
VTSPDPSSFRRALLLIGSVGLIAIATLLPAGPAVQGPRQGGALTDVILNIALFLPLGLALGATGRGAISALAIGGVMSAGIELAQRWIPGRDSSWRDVAANTAGTLLGAIIMARWGERQRWWRALAPGLAALLFSGTIAAGFLVRPSVPEPDAWWGQWAHSLGGSPPFPGQIQNFSVQGVPIPDGPVAAGDSLTVRLTRRQPILITTTIQIGLAPSRPAQIVGLVAGNPGREFMALWQDGATLLAFVRLGTTDASLRTAWFRLDHALPPHEQRTLAMRIDRDAVRLASAGAGDSVTSRYPLTPVLWWNAFLPFDLRVAARNPAWPLVPLIGFFLSLGLTIRRVEVGIVLGLAGLYGGALAAGVALPAWWIGGTAALAVALGGGLARRLGLWPKTTARPPRTGV